MKRLQFIDALKGLAILGVFVVHCSQKVEGIPNWVSSLCGRGALGVQLFFVISAFTILLSLNTRKETEDRLILKFFIRRFFRISPPFYSAFLFYAYHQDYWFSDTQFSIANAISVLTFTQGWSPYWINTIVPGSWAITVEMFFYLLVPFLFPLVQSLDAALYLTVTSLIINKIILLVLLHFPLISEQVLWERFLGYWLPNQLSIFCLGFVLYFLIPRSVIKDYAPKNSVQQKNLSRALFLLIIALWLLVSLAFESYPYIPDHFVGGVAFVLLALSLALYPFWLIINPFWCYLGKISYSAYLTHFAIIHLANDWLNQGLSKWHLAVSPNLKLFVLIGIVLIGTTGVSSLTYRYIELPGQVIGRFLITKLKKQTKSV